MLKKPRVSMTPSYESSITHLSLRSFEHRLTVPEVQVVDYVATTGIKSLMKQDLFMDNKTHFGDRVKRELDENIDNVLAPIHMLFVNVFMNVQLTQRTLTGARMPHSLSAAFLISNICKHADKTSHAFQT